MDASDSNGIQEIVSNNLNVIMDSGYSHQLRKIGLDEKYELIHTISLHSTIYKVMGELEQLKSGLNELGVADEMRKNPTMFESYFTFKDYQDLTAGIQS